MFSEIMVTDLKKGRNPVALQTILYPLTLIGRSLNVSPQFRVIAAWHQAQILRGKQMSQELHSQHTISKSKNAWSSPAALHQYYRPHEAASHVKSRLSKSKTVPAFKCGLMHGVGNRQVIGCARCLDTYRSYLGRT
jgi:hypothetical protein